MTETVAFTRPLLSTRRAKRGRLRETLLLQYEAKLLDHFRSEQSVSWPQLDVGRGSASSSVDVSPVLSLGGCGGRSISANCRGLKSVSVWFWIGLSISSLQKIRSSTRPFVHSHHTLSRRHSMTRNKRRMTLTSIRQHPLAS